MSPAQLFKRHFLPAFAFLVCLLSGCAAPPNTVTQFSSIDALLAGAYDGGMRSRDLLRQGNLGLGTFDRLDGEMIVLDGEIFQVRGDGKAALVDASSTTPFATVVDFKPDQVRSLPSALSLADVEKQIDTMLHTNVMCAIRLKGTFRQMKTRAVPAQTKPYRPLTEVTKVQPEFDLGQCEGTLVGFRSPGFVKGLNVPGYHLHFLTSNRQAGGHVLSFTLESGVLEIANCSRVNIILPKDPSAFQGIDFSRDRSADLEKVEKQQK